MNTRAALWSLSAIAFTGCASILPKAPPQTFYDVAYDPEPVDCARSYPSSVEVWNFAAVAPYDQPEMVVTDGREVSFSRQHQWVDRPGVLVAQRLTRDLGSGRLFPLAVSARDPEGAPLELTGTVYRFAWQREGGSARATVQVEVVLRRTGSHPEVVLHQRYDASSDPETAADDAAAFARAMSVVVARLSTQVRHDLCAAAGGAMRAGSGSGAGGDGCQDRPVGAAGAR